jgi:flagellar hook-associated protein 1 FlgK
MSLSSALSISMTGLAANQAALSIVSSNIGNAQTPGYVARALNQTEQFAGDSGTSVRVLGVIRELDSFVQSQLRTETAGGAYADQISNILAQLQGVYGTPGNAGTLETAFNNFTAAVQALSANSGNQTVQSAAVTAAQSLAQQLNATTNGIQALRSNADQDIGASVAQANDTIKVGILHSLSGTMAISETTLKDVMLMLIDEQNKKGGVLGKKLEAVVVDPASNWPLFAEKARELITKDKVAAVFGCWTSVSRKSVLPVFEGSNALLFYPVQYEGEES